jgi:hypothetical protein
MGKLIVTGTNKLTSGLGVKKKLMVFRKNEMKNPCMISSIIGDHKKGKYEINCFTEKIKRQPYD